VGILGRPVILLSLTPALYCFGRDESSDPERGVIFSGSAMETTLTGPFFGLVGCSSLSAGRKGRAELFSEGEKDIVAVCCLFFDSFVQPCSYCLGIGGLVFGNVCSATTGRAVQYHPFSCSIRGWQLRSYLDPKETAIRSDRCSPLPVCAVAGLSVRRGWYRPLRTRNCALKSMIRSTALLITLDCCLK